MCVTFVDVDFHEVEIYDVLTLSYHAGYITLLRSGFNTLGKEFQMLLCTTLSSSQLEVPKVTGRRQVLSRHTVTF